MMTFNIENSPPTTEQLVEARKQQSNTLIRMAKLERFTRLIAIPLALSGLICLMVLWRDWNTYGNSEIVTPFTLAFVMAFGIFSALIVVCNAEERLGSLGELIAILYTGIMLGSSAGAIGFVLNNSFVSGAAASGVFIG